MSFRVDIVNVHIGWGMQVVEQRQFDSHGLALEFIEELNKDLPAYGLPNVYKMARGPFKQSKDVA
jgi:hypothetical protein